MLQQNRTTLNIQWRVVQTMVKWRNQLRDSDMKKLASWQRHNWILFSRTSQVTINCSFFFNNILSGHEHVHIQQLSLKNPPTQAQPACPLISRPSELNLVCFQPNQSSRFSDTRQHYPTSINVKHICFPTHSLQITKEKSKLNRRWECPNCALFSLRVKYWTFARL